MFDVKISDFKRLEPYQFFLYDNKYREMGTRKIKVPDYLVKKGRPFYVKKKKLKELLLYMVYDTGYYQKVTAEEEEERKQGINQSTEDTKNRKPFNPGFQD